MYTSYIGKKFLKYYNEKERTNYSAKEFFDEIMFPLFFDSSKHLLHVGNSAFFQKPSKKLLEESNSKAEAQLKKLHYDIANEEPNMATFVGYAAKDIKGTTSGQVTNIDFNIDTEEMYFSWIGQSLGIGVSGGFVIAIDNVELLYNIHKGAKHYREYLSKTPNIKDKQIETWNGHWINHFYSKIFENDNIWNNYEIPTKNTNGIISIPTIRWIQLIFTFAKIFPNSELIIYAYNLSQTNTTLGFIKIYLPQIKRLYELRDKLFIDEDKTVLTDKQIELFETFFNFKSVCKQGIIGLKSLEPKGLRQFLPQGSYKYSQGKNLKITENNYTSYLIYKLWVIAMINKTALLQLAEEIAEALISNEKKGIENSRGKTAITQNTKELLDSRNIKVFIENITKLLKEQNENAELFKKVVNEVLKMPVDNFPLFVVLIKFEYNYQKSLGVKNGQ